MQYSIYKDDNVENTVDKIQTILKDTGIDTTVKQKIGEKKGQSAASVRVICSNTDIGTNGKGTSLKNAIASGYAEFMERLQNGILVPYNPADCIYLSKDELKEDKYLQKIIKPEFWDEFIEILERLSDTDKIQAVPFFDVKSEKIKYIPKLIPEILQGTNGMSAGNTKEEALIQGISEISERYAFKNIIINNIKMPEIPKEFYIKYDNIKNIIEDYERLGFKIYVKDASLGKNIPVVCIIAEHKEENLFIIQFGAQPSLPVAIERCLTELAQGKDILDRNYFPSERKMSFYSNKLMELIFNNSIKEFNISLTISRMALEYDNPYRELLLNTDADYEFSQNTWINMEKYYSNKEILNFLLNNIKAITQNNIYIRELSFLNFYSFYIFIPEMSIINTITEKFIQGNLSYIYWKKYNNNYNEDNRHNNIEDLISALEYKNFYSELYVFSPKEYLLLLCSIAMNNKIEIIKYCEIIIEKIKYNQIKMNENGIDIIKCIRDYYSSKELEKKYTANIIKQSLMIIKTTNFNSIKGYIKEKNSINLPNDETKDKIKSILEERFRKNIPNQMNLKDLLRKE